MRTSGLNIEILSQGHKDVGLCRVIPILHALYVIEGIFHGIIVHILIELTMCVV
jgi:hypothetical protein